ncbi:DUF4870 domain-containing protein [Lutibacter flavus]|uniref:Uncharacterized membrane protein n=1 Tax=Lutibacter flavus TaxID=691689 RepID=A0A238VBD9_9FLAO|nr:hypothetical protein [Lutibacter flavus]SNR31541.1 Uncharacterized membrane protein [Lutibacter flavus]
MENQTVKEGKSMAIISYFWWIGLIIAFIMNNSKRNTFASFHIRQMIGLLLLNVGVSLIYKYVGSSVGMLLGLGTFVLWVIGLIGAFQGEEKRVPLIGDLFQDWFKGIG